GDKVLVHAAAGGVGMAAVRIAQHVGGEGYATASPGKGDVLRGTGLDGIHLASSRDLDYAPTFPAIDVVLNSPFGDLIDASLRLLSPGGRFVEMGKMDIRDAGQVVEEYPGIRYRAFDLLDAGLDRIGQILTDVVVLMGAGVLTPLPVSIWDIRRA